MCTYSKELGSLGYFRDLRVKNTSGQRWEMTNKYMLPVTQWVILKGGKEQINLIRAISHVSFLGGLYTLYSVLKMCPHPQHQHHSRGTRLFRPTSEPLNHSSGVGRKAQQGISFLFDWPHACGNLVP